MKTSSSISASEITQLNMFSLQHISNLSARCHGQQCWHSCSNTSSDSTMTKDKVQHDPKARVTLLKYRELVFTYSTCHSHCFCCFFLDPMKTKCHCRIRCMLSLYISMPAISEKQANDL